MQISENEGYSKRTQKDYSLSFKLQLVQEIEQGFLTKSEAKAEHLAERSDKKVIIFDMLIDVAEKECDIQIRKNYKPELSTISKKYTKKP